MQDEADKSRKHELEMISATTAPIQQLEGRNDINSWQPYHMNVRNFQHHPPPFQSQPMSTRGFGETQAYSNVDNCFSDGNSRSYNTL